MTLLNVTGLTVNFYTEDGVAQAIRSVDINISQGETFALVGESGCGKSATALSIMRLIPAPPGNLESGQIIFIKKGVILSCATTTIALAQCEESPFATFVSFVR